MKMKKLFSSIVLLFILMLMAAGAAHAETYYICNTGDNTNNGTSPDTPWATFDYMVPKFNVAKGGDKFLFCKGGKFTSAYLRMANFRTDGTGCLADPTKPCTISTYVPKTNLVGGPLTPEEAEALSKPVIHSTSTTGGIFNFQDGGNADRDGGYRISGFRLQGNGDGWGIFMFNDVNSVFVDDMEIDNFDIAVYSAGANTPNPGADWNNDNITLSNSIITNSGGSGILGGGDNIRLLYNIWDNNGFERAIFNHTIYLSYVTDTVIEGNDVTRNTYIDGMCKAVSIVVHGKANGLTFLNNNVHEIAAHPTCWGISVDPGYTAEEEFHNIAFIGNKVENVGNVMIGCASCVNVVAMNNHLVHTLAGSTTAFAVPVRAEDAVKSNWVYFSGNTVEFETPGGVTKTMTNFVPDDPRFTLGDNSLTINGVPQ